MVKEFRINIKETLERHVLVEEGSLEKAIQKVEQAWKRGEYVLDSLDFTGVEFQEVGESR